MENKYRTQNCGEVDRSYVDKKVKVAGWVNTIRDHGGITFVDLRDQHGVVQIVVSDDKMLDKVGRETVISVEGSVRLRGAENVNEKLKSGDIEIVADSLDVLGVVSAPIPFDVTESKNIREDVRLKYRYMDLRNPAVFNNIIFRSKVNSFLRKEMEELGFIEITTPIISASSPEGARDFLIPARQHPGKFYALPQSPQIFKQLLMVGGFEKYFQIAPCFRDEDARADRTAGEFYQLDMEMSFATQEDFFEIGEKVFYDLFTKFGNKEVSKPPFKRIPFRESMEKYGTDKPDLRNPLVVVNVTKIFENTGFNAFRGSTVKAICVKDMAGQPRSFYDNLTNFMIENGSKGLAWIKVEDGFTFNSPIAKFLTDEEKQALIDALDATVGSSIFLLAGKPAFTTKLSGILRNELGSRLNLCDPNKFELCWIVDFPMYEIDNEGLIQFCHNPFSKVKDGTVISKENALEILANQFDLVGNGVELVSGAERNTSRENMIKLMEIVGYGEEEIENRFPALSTAFKYGAPPHAGMALGVDRTIMLLLDEPNVREVIAFPLNKSGYDPLMNAPGVVDEKQLEDVHIKIDIKEDE